MNILAMDTSTRRISLAVLTGSKILAMRATTAPNLMASNMVPNIERVLTASGLSMADIQTVVVGLGPGSFTGLRVGLATAKGLVFADKAQLIGVSSLDALAYAARNRATSILVITDARRQMVYHALYQYQSGALQKVRQEALGTIAESLEGLSDNTVITGDGIEVYRQEISVLTQETGVQVILTDARLWQPRAKYLAVAARQRLERGEADDVASLIPLYIYPDTCQIRKAP